ncbi:MAG TPA: YCF48-related protein [Blastocatellia bacterium]|nr:YCF48-related protein [Blastocatellia bacterium]
MSNRRARRSSVIFSGLIFLTALHLAAFAQQGWSRLTTIQQDGQPAVINAVTYDGDDIWVVGAKGLIARSSDEGRTFNAVASSVDVGLNDVTVRGERITIVGDQGTILRSTDGGRSFIRSNYSLRYREAQGEGSLYDLYSAQMIDKDRGYIVGDHGLILMTNNGGASWREQHSGTEAQLFHLSFRDDRGWAVGTGGTLLHTNDGGRNWYPQRSGVQEDLNRVYFIDDHTGLITGDKGVLLRSENGGATWERVSLKVAGPLFGMSFVDKKTGWVVGYQGRIIRTYNGGRDWIEQDSATTADLFSVSFYKNRGYAIGRDGLVMRYYEKR